MHSCMIPTDMYESFTVTLCLYICFVCKYSDIKVLARTCLFGILLLIGLVLFYAPGVLFYEYDIRTYYIVQLFDKANVLDSRT